MFNNIGGKIKGLAKIVCYMGIICYSVIGCVIIAKYKSFGLGIGILVIGSLLSWVSSFVLYGFGQLVENSDMLVAANCENKPKEKKEKSNINKE